MDKITLNAQKRTIVGRKVKKLRKDDIVPANLYGKKIKSQAVQVAEKEFGSVFSKVGETGLVELALDKAAHPVLIHNVAVHPVTGTPLHVDFFQVDLREKIQTKVPLSFAGDAPAVVNKIGVLLHILPELEIEALPTDLPEKIVVDVSKLAAVGDVLKVSDLLVSDKIKILTDVNLELVKVAPLVSKEAEQMARQEAEAKAAAAAEKAAEAGVPPAEGKPAEAAAEKPPTAAPTVPPASSAAPSGPKKEKP